jgi:cell division transport system permease protein
MSRGFLMSAFRLAPRQPPLLPHDRERDLSLHFVVAVLCFLACIAALGARGADRAATGWANDLRGEATVQVRPGPNETPAAAGARAAELLAGVKGVSEAAAMEPAKAEALLKPWLGDAVLKDLPVPQLVTVELDPQNPANAGDLRKALAGAGIDATVDDHRRWQSDIEDAAGLVRTGAFVIFVLTGGAAAAMVAFAVRAGMAAQRDAVEVLHLAGAEDRFIAGLVQARFARLAGVAGLIGAASAALVGLVLILFGGREGFSPALPLRWADLSLLSPCPLVAATVAAVAARLTTLRFMRETE